MATTSGCKNVGNARHITTYRYTRPAWDSFNELRLHPADDYRQTLLAFELNVSPKVTLRTRRDSFDNLIHHNLIHHFHLPGDHTCIRRLILSTRTHSNSYLDKLSVLVLN